MESFEYVQPTGLDEALTLLAEPGTLAQAGGVDLLDRLKEGLDTPKRLVSLRKVKELSGIAEVTGGLRVGALVTLDELARHPTMRTRARALAEAALHTATPNVRNQATIGGNLVQRPRCWYFRSDDFHCRKKGGPVCYALDGENEFHSIFGNTVCAALHASTLAPALVALGATLDLVSKKGSRTLAVSDFFMPPEREVTKDTVLEPGELVRSVFVPLGQETDRSAYTKQGQRESYDWPLVDVAVWLRMDGETVRDLRIVLGAVAPVPRRATAAEGVLRGKKLTDASARAAGARATEGATPLAQNRYKLPMLSAVVARTLLGAEKGA